MITPRQLKAARGGLGWSMRDLADKSRISLQTAHRFEAGGELREATLSKIEAALDRAGMILVEPDRSGGEGVRFAKAKPRRKAIT
jgi:transcriptional regulator with XRE-family HTH domain